MGGLLRANRFLFVGLGCIAIALINLPQSQAIQAAKRDRQKQAQEQAAVACSWVKAKAPILVSGENQPITITSGRVYSGSADTQGNGQSLAIGSVIRDLSGNVAVVVKGGAVQLIGSCPELANLPEYQGGITTMQKLLILGE